MIKMHEQIYFQHYQESQKVVAGFKAYCPLMVPGYIGEMCLPWGVFLSVPSLNLRDFRRIPWKTDG